MSAVTRKNTREAYDTLYRSPELLAEYLQSARLRFYDEVATACAEAPFESVLDAGCGTGHLLLRIAERTEGMPTLCGFDYAPAGVDRARELLPGADIRVGDIYDPPFDGLFDLVVCSEVLEHLDAPELALSALAAHCAPRGRLVVTVPDGRHDDWDGHLNFWSADEFRSLLECFGTTAVGLIDEKRTIVGVVRPTTTVKRERCEPKDDVPVL